MPQDVARAGQLVLAAPAALARWMATFLFGVEPFDSARLVSLFLRWQRRLPSRRPPRRGVPSASIRWDLQERVTTADPRRPSLTSNATAPTSGIAMTAAIAISAYSISL
jgi:hypothetical protein